MSKDKRYRVKDYSGWSIFIFGVLAALLGLTGLIKPEITLGILGFELIPRAARAASDYTIVFVIASSVASLNMGIYYILAALNDLKIFYRWTVPFRGLTFIIFTLTVMAGAAPSRFMGVAAWELLGALATGITL